MKKLFAAALVTILLFAFVPTAFADDATPPDSDQSIIEDILERIANAPALLGLGAVSSLLVMLARRLKLPDGYGGYANLVVGFFAVIASLFLSESARANLFEALELLARFLAVVGGGQLFHAGAKYAGLDWLWKGGDD